MLQSLKCSFIIHHRPLLTLYVAPYHLYTIMQGRENVDQHIKIYQPAYHLYVDKLIHEPFHERSFALLLNDCSRTIQTHNNYLKMFDFAYQHINQMTNVLTLISLLCQMFQYNHRDQLKAKNIAEAAFNLLKHKQETGLSYHYIKFLVAIDEIIGLTPFTNDQYKLLHPELFKPIFVCFTLELFFKNKLEKSYPLVEELIQLFIKNEEYIPYLDIHHLGQVRKTIHDERFQNCIKRVIKKRSNRIQEIDQEQEGMNEDELSGHYNQHTKLSYTESHPSKQFEPRSNQPLKVPEHTTNDQQESSFKDKFVREFYRDLVDRYS